MRPVLSLVALLLVSGCAPDDAPAPAARGADAEGLVVRDAVARPAPAGGVSAAFFQIANETDAADTLVAARTDVSLDVQIHRTTGGPDGMRGMERIAGVPVPAGGAVALEPGGLHLMLIGLDRDLAVGDTVVLRLDFARQGPLSLRAPVRLPAP